MNNVSRKSLDWHPYKAAGFPGLPINDMFIKDVNMNIIRVLNLASVHIEDVEYVDCVQQYLSSAEMLSVERSNADWGDLNKGFVPRKLLLELHSRK
jgi:hypothetical protein